MALLIYAWTFYEAKHYGYDTDYEIIFLVAEIPLICSVFILLDTSCFFFALFNLYFLAVSFILYPIIIALY